MPRPVARARLAELSASLLLAMLAGGAAGEDSAAPASAVEAAVYEFEVAVMCGLATPPVQRGFRRTIDALVAAGGMDRAAFEQARMRGWVAAEREWGNRGLGGFRGWCRTEGANAAARFARAASTAADAGLAQ